MCNKAKTQSWTAHISQLDFSPIRGATKGYVRLSYSDELSTEAERQLLLGRKIKNDLPTVPISNAESGIKFQVMSIFMRSQNLSDFAFEIIKKKENLKLLLGAHRKGQCLSPPALLIA